LAVTFRILGSLLVSVDGRPVEVSAPKQRTVLGLLLCRANTLVPVSTFVQTLWDDRPPPTAHKNVQVYVSGLRKAIGASVRYQSPGYVLQVEPAALDALRLRDLARAGRSALRDGALPKALGLLDQARRLWHGPVLPDLVSAPSLAAEAERLRELHLAVFEDWAEAKLAIGHHRELLDDLDDLVSRHPFRERLRHTQMLALHRSGRRSEALAVYDALRQHLARDLGLEPSPVLERLWRDILAGDPRLDAAVTGRLPAPPVALTRSTVTDRSRLPRDPAHFIGRDDETATLLDWLGADEPGRSATISGPTGVGKTTLAVHCARRLGGRYPGGRVLMPLRHPDGTARNPDEVIDDLRRWFGRGNPPRPEPAAGPAGPPSWAPDGPPTLVILDDAVTEEQVRPVLETAGDCAVVVTGRRHLGGLHHAKHIALEPLSDADAVRLLGQLIGDDRITAEPDAAGRLVAACDRLPLAVHIAGAKLAALRHLGLAPYADRLSDERRVLAELAVGDTEIRPRLRAAYRDLTGDERTAALVLGRLPRPVFTTTIAATALGVDEPVAETAIERLISAGLVEAYLTDVAGHADPRAVRYRLPSLTRAFVRDSPCR
jgi:DNA-binding SARP family transcriptional activator